MAGRYKITKVKGADPEQFLLVWLDSDVPPGTFIQTGVPMSEAEVRAGLKKDGRSEIEINSVIEQARRDEA